MAKARSRKPNVTKVRTTADLKAAIESERQDRARACQAEIETSLRTHRCAFYVSLTLGGDRQVFQVDVTALE